MKHIYIYRHGQSETNKLGGYWPSGPQTIPLTPKGLADSKKFASNWEIQHDLVAASPYTRAQQTIAPLAQKFNMQVVTLPVFEFTYWNLDLTSEQYAAIGAEKERYWSELNIHEKKGDGAESFYEFYQRVQAFHKWVLTTTDFKVCVLCAHGFWMHAFRRVMQGNLGTPRELMRELRDTLNDKPYANLQVEHYAIPERISVITTSRGSEASISQLSAANVSKALETHFKAVQVLPYDEDLASHLRDCDIAFPVAHGQGETGDLQSLFEKIGLPYVGSGPASCSLTWNKARANGEVQQWIDSFKDGVRANNSDFGICVPKFVEITSANGIAASAIALINSLPPNSGLVSKPTCEGSSVGVHFFQHPLNPLLHRDEVERKLENFDIAAEREAAIVGGVLLSMEFGGSAILHEAISGMEVSVAVFAVEGREPTAFPVAEIVSHAAMWYDFQSKYATNGSTHFIPARLPTSILRFIEQCAVYIHDYLGCQDYSRVDFIVEMKAGQPQRLAFLELNTLPGICDTSLYPEMASHAGRSLGELTYALVMNAASRSLQAQVNAKVPGNSSIKR